MAAIALLITAPCHQSLAVSTTSEEEDDKELGAFNMIAKRLATMACLAVLAATPIAAQEIGDGIDAANRGVMMDQGRDPKWHLAQHRKLSAAISALLPQRAGTIDAYVLAVGLDADPVFGREAAEASRVLARRFGATGRTMLIAAGDGAGNPAVPHGSPASMATALAAIAAKMNLAEDVLILFITAHGGPRIGLAYQDGENGWGLISPARLAVMLESVGIKRRMILISACYSGAFIPPIQSESSVIVTAAADDRTSFGCEPGNDWTFFGDALINTSMRQPKPLEQVTADAFAMIQGWEQARNLTPSNPQQYFGAKVREWLTSLEQHMPKVASAKVGRPAIGAGTP